MDEPIRHFLANVGFNLSEIREYVIGDLYTGLMLQNGNIGVCANLDTIMDDDLMRGTMPNPDLPHHRVILNAWFNAKCNYTRVYNNEIDIFDSIDFRNEGKIVMVGYFESLYEKFMKSSIGLSVFDILKNDPVLESGSNFRREISAADTIILTGTTVFNNTFTDILAMTRKGSNIYLLGPSNILSGDMLRYRNVRIVFGSVFRPYDYSLIERIREGAGTRDFLDKLKKVYIASES